MQAEAMNSCHCNELRWILLVEPAAAHCVCIVTAQQRAFHTAAERQPVAFCCMHEDKYSKSPATMLLRYL